MRLDSFFFGALCVMSGGRLPAALFMVFLLDSKGAKRRLCSFYSCLQNSHLHHPGTCLASQVLSSVSVQSLLALLEQRARVHLLFSTALGSLHCCGLMVLLRGRVLRPEDA